MSWFGKFEIARQRHLAVIQLTKIAGYFLTDEIFNQYEWKGWAFGNLREDNDLADVTLACEDIELMEAHKVILAGQVCFTKSSHSQHHFNNFNNSIEQQTRGCSCIWDDAQLPTFPQLRYRSINYPWALMV